MHCRAPLTQGMRSTYDEFGVVRLGLAPAIAFSSVMQSVPRCRLTNTGLTDAQEMHRYARAVVKKHLGVGVRLAYCRFSETLFIYVWYWLVGDFIVGIRRGFTKFTQKNPDRYFINIIVWLRWQRHRCQTILVSTNTPTTVWIVRCLHHFASIMVSSCLHPFLGIQSGRLMFWLFACFFRQMKYEGGANPREGIIENVFEAAPKCFLVKGCRSCWKF